MRPLQKIWEYGRVDYIDNQENVPEPIVGPVDIAEPVSEKINQNTGEVENQQRDLAEGY